MNQDSYVYQFYLNQTLNPLDSYEHEIQDLETALETVSTNWEITDKSCSTNACMVECSGMDGETAVAALFYYPVQSDAQNAYNSAKYAHGSYRVIDIDIGDEGYVWLYSSQSEAGFINGQIVGIVDYYSITTDATISDAQELAEMILQKT